MSSLIRERSREVVVPPNAPPSELAPAERTAGVRSLGLTGRLLALTIGSVLLVLTLFYTTRLSAARENWLRDRLVAARTATLVFGADDQDGALPEDLTMKILNTVGAKMISVETGGHRLVLSASATPPTPDYVFDLSNPSLIEGVEAGFQTLLASDGSLLQVSGAAPMDGATIEITIDQTPLIAAMWRLSRTYLTILLLESTLVTCVLWAALWQLVIRPVRRLTSSIIAFGERPQEAQQIVAPSGRNDEIGRAEAALAVMQDSLAHELGQRRRLAELGMAVARINHDLRNMLAAAQLISDRLATIPDPLAQRLAPRLVATLDRAILFCQSTLTYGAAREQAPARRPFDLRETVRQVVETAQATSCGAIAYAIEIPPNFELFADPDHVQRTIENLARNAAQALQSQGVRGHGPPAIRFVAIRTDGVALIEISDNGPGFPPEQASRIFEPFHLSTREGGSGLGLAIAADLVARNGGSIALAPSQPDDFYCGARFLITLPAAEDTHKSARAASAA
jgi:signal transduction histidine kinase